MELDKVLKKRQSIKDYSIKKVSFKDLISICNAALSAPMAGNIYTIKLILVSDKKKKQELAEAALDQEFIAEASYIIVVCSDTTQILRSYGKHAEIYIRQQAGAVIENMLLKITDLEFASCWVGAFDENAVKRILNVPENIQIEALLPVAYAKSGVKAKTKLEIKLKIKPELKQILNFEKFGVKTTKPGRRETPF